MATIIDILNQSDESMILSPIGEPAIKPGETISIDLEQVADLDSLLAVVRGKRVEVLQKGHAIGPAGLSALATPLLRKQSEFDAKIGIQELKSKLAKSLMLANHPEVAQGEQVKDWANRPGEQITEIDKLLRGDLPAAGLSANVDKAIETVNQSIREFEDYLISRTEWSLRRQLHLAPDVKKPFQADAQRSITRLFARVGTIRIRLNSVPDEDREKTILVSRLDEVDHTLEELTVAAGASDISWAHGILDEIERRLPLPSQFWSMLLPILGAATLQGVIWWIAIYQGPRIAKLLEVNATMFGGMIIAGTLGSLARVIFRAIGLQYQTYKQYTALYVIGLVRPILGAVMALAVFFLFNSTWVAIPVPESSEDALLGSLTVAEAFFVFAGFRAGFSDEWLLNLGPIKKAQQ